MTAGWKRTVTAVGGGLQLQWRIRLGWIVGHGLLVLTHVGRHTGKQYRTVLYVQRYDDRSREATVISVWGDSQWFRNISAKPAAQVETGLQRYAPQQRFLNAEEIVELEKRFRTRHRIIAWGALRAVAFAPRSTDAASVAEEV